MPVRRVAGVVPVSRFGGVIPVDRLHGLHPVHRLGGFVLVRRVAGIVPVAVQRQVQAGRRQCPVQGASRNGSEIREAGAVRQEEEGETMPPQGRPGRSGRPRRLGWPEEGS